MQTSKPTVIRSSLLMAALAVCLLAIAALIGLSTAGSAAAQSAASAAADTAKSCRYGATSFYSEDQPYLDNLGVGWTQDFFVHLNRTFAPGVEYAPMLRLESADNAAGYQVRYGTPALNGDPGGLGPVLQANPGMLWIVGNEPDRKVVQDELLPAVYARAYHDIYTFIKLWDPTAQVANAGLVQFTPGRQQYLTLVWESYREQFGASMPVDVWNMHLYILPEKRQDGGDSDAAIAVGTEAGLAMLESFDPDGSGPLSEKDSCDLPGVYCRAEHDSLDIFEAQVVRMRTWMKDHGQQNKPLILSEYSLLYPYTLDVISDPSSCFLQDEFGNCFTPARVSSYLTETFTFLDSAVSSSLGNPRDGGRLVQQWQWYAMEDDRGASPDMSSNLLLNNGSGLSQVGLTFQNWMDQPEQNLDWGVTLDGASHNITSEVDASGVATLTLSVDIWNSGSGPTPDPLTAYFFADAEHLVPLGSVTIPAGLGGCARHSATAAIEAQFTGVGPHDFYVVVAGAEAKGSATVAPYGVFLPVVVKN